MILCSICRSQELEGELYCSDCGARLPTEWLDPSINSLLDAIGRPGQAGLETDSLRSQLLPGQIGLLIGDSTEPLILEGRSEYLLGRDNSPAAGQEVDLNAYGGRDQGVSRVHAALRHERHRVLVVDLGSTNGTRLNGSLLPANEPAAVESGDKIRLGKLALKIIFVP